MSVLVGTASTRSVLACQMHQKSSGIWALIGFTVELKAVVTTTIRLRFDHAIRKFDDLRHDRTPTSVGGLLRCGLNE